MGNADQFLRKPRDRHHMHAGDAEDGRHTRPPEGIGDFRVEFVSDAENHLLQQMERISGNIGIQGTRKPLPVCGKRCCRRHAVLFPYNRFPGKGGVDFDAGGPFCGALGKGIPFFILPKKQGFPRDQVSAFHVVVSVAAHPDSDALRRTLRVDGARADRQSHAAAVAPDLLYNAGKNGLFSGERAGRIVI